MTSSTRYYLLKLLDIVNSIAKTLPDGQYDDLKYKILSIDEQLENEKVSED